MVIETSRRSLLIGLTGLIAAPAIVRASSLMKVRAAPVAPVAPNIAYWMGANGFYAFEHDGIADEFTAYAVQDCLGRMALGLQMARTKALMDAPELTYKGAKIVFDLANHSPE